MPNSELLITNDLVISNTSTTGSLQFTLLPNTELSCRNITISGSSAGAQNAIFECFPNSSSVEVNGNVIISSGGKLKLSDGNNATDDGVLKVKGNFINNGAVTDAELGNSKIILNGSNTQTITCPANSVFCDLELSNTSGVPVLLNNDIKVERLLSLQNGKLDLNERTLTLGSSTSPANVTGASSSSYIILWDGADNGTIRHLVPSTGSSYYFPMGDLTNYTPFEVLLNAGTLSNAFITGKLSPVSHPNLGTATHYLNRHWIIEQTGITNPLYDVEYGYALSDIEGSDAFIYPAKYNAGGWQSSSESGSNAMIGNGSVNTATRAITWSGITSFSEFTAFGSGTALPIELLEFTAHPLDKIVNLLWTTASEANNSHFVIERSRNTITTEEIARIEGAGNSNSIRNYKTTDENPMEGISYYRLKQIDYDGKFSHSEWVAVNFAGSRRVDIDAVFVSKNTGELIVKCANPVCGQAEFQIFDTGGKLVRSFHPGAISANWSGSIPLDSEASGSYILRLSADGQSAFRKFVVH